MELEKYSHYLRWLTVGVGRVAGSDSFEGH